MTNRRPPALPAPPAPPQGQRGPFCDCVLVGAATASLCKNTNRQAVVNQFDTKFNAALGNSLEVFCEENFTQKNVIEKRFDAKFIGNELYFIFRSVDFFSNMGFSIESFDAIF